MFEKLDIYDQNRNKTGEIIERKEGETTKLDEFIVAVQCWIFNSKGRILLTQRKADKTGGNMWEPTGGLVQSGEYSIEGMKRELKEEIGIEVPEEYIKLYKTFTEKGNVNVFRDIYVINNDILLNNLKFNDGEVVDAKYVDIDELRLMIDNGEAFEWLIWILEEYHKMSNLK